MLANCIIGLPAPFLLRCFVSGLASEIRREVQALHPLTLVQAVGLARLQEEKLADQCRGVSRGFRSRAQLALGFSLPPAPLPPPIPPLLPSPAKPPPLNVRRLSPEEITMRREKGLCFNCNKRFSRGHKCSSRFSLLFAAAEEEDEPSCTNPNITPNISDPPDPGPNKPLCSCASFGARNAAFDGPCHPTLCFHPHWRRKHTQFCAREIGPFTWTPGPTYTPSLGCRRQWQWTSLSSTLSRCWASHSGPDVHSWSSRPSSLRCRFGPWRSMAKIFRARSHRL